VSNLISFVRSVSTRLLWLTVLDKWLIGSPWCCALRGGGLQGRAGSQLVSVVSVASPLVSNPAAFSVRMTMRRGSLSNCEFEVKLKRREGVDDILRMMIEDG
jgi:hypothetical protein